MFWYLFKESAGFTPLNLTTSWHIQHVINAHLIRLHYVIALSCDGSCVLDSVAPNVTFWLESGKNVSKPSDQWSQTSICTPVLPEQKRLRAEWNRPRAVKVFNRAQRNPQHCLVLRGVWKQQPCNIKHESTQTDIRYGFLTPFFFSPSWT